MQANLEVRIGKKWVPARFVRFGFLPFSGDICYVKLAGGEKCGFKSNRNVRAMTPRTRKLLKGW